MNRKMTIYHANARGTGSVLGIELRPVEVPSGGQVLISLAKQKAIRKDGKPITPQFDYENRIWSCLDPWGVEQIIEVVEGSAESINDGKGIICNFPGGTSTFKFSNVIDPVCGYRLEIEKRLDGETVKGEIFLSPSEGQMLARGFKASMGLLLFGEGK